MPGYNEIIIFQKLKDCLEEPALSMVSSYSAVSVNSYEAAINDLFEVYEDPIRLAGNYINRATQGSHDKFSMAEAILQAFNALHGMKDVFEQENVDMFDFSLMHVFCNAMPQDMRADWNGFKVKKKEEHKLMVETSPEKVEHWKSGMAENYKTFSAWLTLFKAKKPNNGGSTSLDNEGLTSTAANFAINGSSKPGQFKCFICKKNNHHVTKCSKALNMTFQEWRQICCNESTCYKCTKPFTQGHQKTCVVSCNYCRGKSYNNDHCSVMCPMNSGRTFPSNINKQDKTGFKQKSSGKSFDQKRKRKNSGKHESEDRYAKMTKLLERVDKNMRPLLEKAEQNKGRDKDLKTKKGQANKKILGDENE
jgi:hypothetical protein